MKSVLIYDSRNFNGTHFNKGPTAKEMETKRSHHSCTIFNSKYHDDRPVAIVAGGGSNTAEVLDFTCEKSTWISSKGLSIYEIR